MKTLRVVGAVCFAFERFLASVVTCSLFALKHDLGLALCWRKLSDFCGSAVILLSCMLVLIERSVLMGGLGLQGKVW